MALETILGAGQTSSSLVDIVACYETLSQSGSRYVILKDQTTNSQFPQFHVAEKVNGLTYFFLFLFSWAGINLNAYTTKSIDSDGLQNDLLDHLSERDTQLTQDFTTRFVETTKKALGSDDAREALIVRLDETVRGLERLASETSMNTTPLQEALTTLKESHEAILRGDVTPSDTEDDAPTHTLPPLEDWLKARREQFHFKEAPSFDCTDLDFETKTTPTSSTNVSRALSIDSGNDTLSPRSPSSASSRTSSEIEAWEEHVGLPFGKFQQQFPATLPSLDNSQGARLREILRQINED